MEHIHSSSQLNKIKVKPIESMSICDSTLYKCYTYFSHHDPIWKDNDIDFRQMRMEVYLGDESLAHATMPMFFALHSPNDMPTIQYGKILPLMSNAFYMLDFSIIKVKRLGHLYDTDCRTYGEGQTYFSRNGCKVQCIKIIMIQYATIQR